MSIAIPPACAAVSSWPVAAWGERMELDISPMPASRMREILEKTFAASPEIIKRAGAALE